MKIKDLFTDASRWTTKTYARDKDGAIVNQNDPNACSWCLVGAVLACYKGAELLGVLFRLNAEIGVAYATWNDAPERTFEEVKALVNKLDI